MKIKFQLVSANFRFRAEWVKVTSRAEIFLALAMARISLAQTYHYYLVGTHKVSLVVGKGLICLSKFGGDQSPRPYTFRWPLLSKGTHFSLCIFLS